MFLPIGSCEVGRRLNSKSYTIHFMRCFNLILNDPRELSFYLLSDLLGKFTLKKLTPHKFNFQQNF